MAGHVGEKDLLAALHGSDAAVASNALLALQADDLPLSDALVRAVIVLLAAPSKRLRRRSADVLARAAGQARYRDEVHSLLDDPRAGRRWAAAFALARAGLADDAVCRVAIEALGSEDRDRRWSAAELVCRLAAGNQDVLAGLRGAARGGEVVQRKMALYCLRDLHETDPAVFLQGLEHEDRGIRLAALSGLACVRGAGEELVGRVVGCANDDTDPGVRRSAAVTLERITEETQKSRREKMSPSNSNLASRHCEPCRGGMPPLSEEQWKPLLASLAEGWEVEDGHHLSKAYRFRDFQTALAFVNRVGEIAEAEGHHPDLYLSWGKVRVELWTHKIGGLSEADFILAAKADAIE